MRQKIKSILGSIPVIGNAALKVLKSMLDYNLVNISQIQEVTIPPYIDSKASRERNEFYSCFENVFRGDESLISKRQSAYLKYIHNNPGCSEGSYFLDIGCGRGEFLKLLINSGIAAKGIELNKIECEKLNSQGIAVELIDANSYLESITNNSLIGISAFQVIEHLAFDYFENFLDLASKKIKKNGVIILETINPKCSLALSNFYIDPTHIRPYPFELVKFMMEWYGIKDIVSVFSSPCPPELQIKTNVLHNYMDYSLIGWKR
jgi:O-antigen chain-terminating methyltransferase